MLKAKFHLWLLAVWLCFLARAFFYCAAMPLWEGYDEWAHFAVVERMAFRGELLVARDAAVGRDVAASLELAPVPWELRTLPPPSATHDVFWRLSAGERERRESLFRSIPQTDAYQDAPGNLRAYEGLQGPLYGWIMAPLLFAAGHAHLATQVLLLRWFSVVIVSLVIPLSFLIGRAVFEDDAVALGCAAMVTVMPEFLIDVSRVGNDSIAVVLFTVLVWLSLVVLRDGLTRGRALALGVVLGFGLIAKAYFLTALPPIAILLLWKCPRARALLVPLAAFAIAGWWYIRNLVTTGSFTGMWETALLSHASLGAQLQQVARIPWRVAIDSILLSHLYFGAWSSLTVRSWMYHLFYALIALAVVGQAFSLSTARAERLLLAGFLLAFWLGQLYHVIPMFMVWGIATSLGCYLYAIVAAEVVLCTGGLRALAPRAVRRFIAPAGVFLFALLDLYTMHMMAIPYYTGLIAHRPHGPVTAFHPVGVNISEVLARLAAFKSPLLNEPILAALWLGYAAATLALVAISFWMIRQETSNSQSPPLPGSHSAAASPETAASGPTSPVPLPPTAAR